VATDHRSRRAAVAAAKAERGERHSDGDTRMPIAAARRVVLVCAALVGIMAFVSAATFFLLRTTRDPVPIVAAQRQLDPSDPAVRAKLEAELGTDRPLVVQYGDWLGHAVRGDLGTSYLNEDRTVADTIGRALPINLELVVLAQLIALAVGVPLGLAAGARSGSLLDRTISSTSAVLLSAPGFVVALVLITIFAVGLDWFPVSASGYVGLFESPGENLRQMALPAISLAIPMIGVYARILRSDMESTMQQDFILVARAKGLRPVRVLVRHAFRPSSLSLIPVVALQFGGLLGGSIFVERLFAFPAGLGTSLAIAAIVPDIPMLLGITVVVALTFAIVTILADLLAKFADPRIGSGST
jgi:peptide/nickel transport system permease protein